MAGGNWGRTRAACATSSGTATVGSDSPSRYFVRASVSGREGCLVMDWKIIIVVLVFIGGAWMFGRMMTDSGRNNDDGGSGS